jgi:6-phosphogluconolactonase
MEIDVAPDDESVARRAASEIATAFLRRVNAGRDFVVAISGGRTPWKMLDHLATHDLPWSRIHLLQVDERVAPDGDPDRNWTHVRAHLLDRVAIPADRVHPMPVALEDPERAAADYARTLREVAGDPPILDVVHLGLGADGHTASLVPGDAVLDAVGDVAATDTYAGRRRITLTFPLLNRARHILWVVTGAEKAPSLRRLVRGDPSIPAGLVRSTNARILTDVAAAGCATVSESRPTAPPAPRA